MRVVLRRRDQSTWPQCALAAPLDGLGLPLSRQPEQIDHPDGCSCTLFPCTRRTDGPTVASPSPTPQLPRGRAAHTKFVSPRWSSEVPPAAGLALQAIAAAEPVVSRPGLRLARAKGRRDGESDWMPGHAGVPASTTGFRPRAKTRNSPTEMTVVPPASRQCDAGAVDGGKLNV